MKNTKAKGSRTELELMHALEKAFFSVTKSGASLGLFDLIAFNHRYGYLIQVKSNRKPDKEEMKRLFYFNNYPSNFQKLIAIKHDYYGWKIYEIESGKKIEYLENKLKDLLKFVTPKLKKKNSKKRKSI